MRNVKTDIERRTRTKVRGKEPNDSLKSSPPIHRPDALEMDWAVVLRSGFMFFVYGNPPFGGGKYLPDAAVKPFIVGERRPPSTSYALLSEKRHRLRFAGCDQGALGRAAAMSL
jgi:hypothetical protein